MATLVTTITETLRYRGKLGQWSWVLHRIAGLGTLLFLFLHVIDMSWAVFYPGLLKEAIAQYQTPLFTAGEFALVACVVYHALNGFRVVIFDWRPRWWHRQADAARLVLLGTVVILIPVFILMFGHVVRYYQTDAIRAKSLTELLRLEEIIVTSSRFALGIGGILVGALLISVVYSVIPGVNKPKKGHRSRIDAFVWLYMRVSGVLILPLVFGHLGMMHVVQGVFDITTPDLAPVGTTIINDTGSAVEFVALRWNTMFAGVFIWRVYDALLLILTVIHGFFGLRYVVNDYVSNIVLNRALNIAIFATALGLIIVGGLAIIGTVPAETVRQMERAAQAMIR